MLWRAKVITAAANVVEARAIVQVGMEELVGQGVQVPTARGVQARLEAAAPLLLMGATYPVVHLGHLHAHAAVVFRLIEWSHNLSYAVVFSRLIWQYCRLASY